MAKATVTDLQNQGWRAAQFGDGFADAAAFAAFLQAPLDEAGAWARAKLGASPYDDVTAGTHAHYTIARAECSFAAALLWKRRATFVDSQASTGLEGGGYLNRREYLANADAAMQSALDALSEAARELGVDLSGLGDVPALATGYIETGRYPQTSEAPIND